MLSTKQWRDVIREYRRPTKASLFGCLSNHINLDQPVVRTCPICAEHINVMDSIVSPHKTAEGCHLFCSECQEVVWLSFPMGQLRLY